MKANEFITEKWSQKYKNSINCSHPKGFSQRAHCAGKKKHNENVEMEMVCEDCGMCQTHGSLNEIRKGQKDSNGFTKCWPGKHAEGTKQGKNGPVRNCVPNESEEGGNILDKQLKDIDPVDHGDDEGHFVKNQIHTMLRVLTHLENAIGDDEDLPEWVEMKISQAQGMIVGVMDYMISDKEQEVEHQTGQDALMKEEFDLIESIIEDLAASNGVDSEVIWEDLESLSDDELYVFATTTTIMETEAWQKANNKDRTNGMSRKAVKAYRREHPGSKLQTAVTTKPSKLKKGSKASKRRKSYCSRSKGQMKMHNISCAKTPDKAICKARRRWNC